MISILIVDDNIDKIRAILNVILTKTVVTREQIFTAHCTSQAIAILKTVKIDLLILDMQIAKHLDTTPDPAGGLALLDEIYQIRKIAKPHAVLAITEHDQVYLDNNEVLRNKGLVLSKYDAASQNWVSQLEETINRTVASKDGNYPVQNIDYDYDVAIITALHKTELESILAFGVWEEVVKDNDPNTIYHIGEFAGATRPIRVVAAAAQQMGMPASSALTMKTIMHFKPRYVFMAGITAGCKGTTEYGDIIVAECSWDSGAGKIKTVRKETVFEPDPRQIPISSDLIARFKVLEMGTAVLSEIHESWGSDKPETPPKLHVGPLACGASVLQDKVTLNQIKKQSRKLLGFEMEAYGVYFAASNAPEPKPKFCAIKSVCDFGDVKKVDKFQKYAAYTSARFLHFFITTYLNY